MFSSREIFFVKGRFSGNPSPSNGSEMRLTFIGPGVLFRRTTPNLLPWFLLGGADRGLVRGRKSMMGKARKTLHRWEKNLVLFQRKKMEPAVFHLSTSLMAFLRSLLLMSRWRMRRNNGFLPRAPNVSTRFGPSNFFNLAFESVYKHAC